MVQGPTGLLNNLLRSNSKFFKVELKTDLFVVLSGSIESLKGTKLTIIPITPEELERLKTANKIERFQENKIVLIVSGPYSGALGIVRKISKEGIYTEVSVFGSMRLQVFKPEELEPYEVRTF